MIFEMLNFVILQCKKGINQARFKQGIVLELQHGQAAQEFTVFFIIT